VKIQDIDVESTIESVKQSLKEEKGLSPALRSSLEVLLLLVGLLLNRITLNGSTSSIPPSQDPNRDKKESKPRASRKPGGQKGHKGITLEPVAEPDEIVPIKIDKRTIPKGVKYEEVSYESRQVFDIKICTVVTEYRAQILEGSDGYQYTAPFPAGVLARAQYGNTVKVQAVYLSQKQLIPYERVHEQFADQFLMPLSTGTIHNFNRKAFDMLEEYERWVKYELTNSTLLHVDETGININGNRHWLHCASNLKFTYYYPHERRGTEAMNEIDILPHFTGVLCHDHWKPYYTYLFCLHSLCNAHHLRELQRAWEQDKQAWAKTMRQFLIELNAAVDEAQGKLDPDEATRWYARYRRITKKAQIECPAPTDNRRKGASGRIKRSKSRNLLERLIKYEDDVLRFMSDAIVPFTNNLGENDIRMTKVQQKISGCFRSMDGALISCRIRGYLSTCRKNGVSATDALTMLFDGQMPSFISDTLKSQAQAA